MSESVENSHLKKYFESIKESYALGNIETSYNEPIIKLFNTFGCSGKDMSGERSGQAGENIDIKLWHNENEVTDTEPFAGIEVKKIGGIDSRAKEQIKVETLKYGNAILTDNLIWEFWHCKDNTAQKYATVELARLQNEKLQLHIENEELFTELVKDFVLKQTEIKSSNVLAVYMAKHARTIKSIIIGILKENDKGLPEESERQLRVPMFSELLGLFNKIKSELRPAMKTRDFADMYAQTIVYGLFIARYNDKSLDSFDRYEAIAYLQEESELLKQFFIHITSSGRRNNSLDVIIDKLCSLYRTCDLKDLLDKDNSRDPITHFYEEFLKYYDPELRKELGVFYTPVQAVKYLVTQVDALLCSEFNIENGLANNETIDYTVPTERHQIAKNKNAKFHDSITIQVPRVAVLDPACGTGSFCSEIVKHVKTKYYSGNYEPFYSEDIKSENGLLSRIIGFEIMMTSYVVAHLKLRRTIDQTLVDTTDTKINPCIYLTNTLSTAKADLERIKQISFLDFSNAITDEAYKADTWKIRRPIKVVIGNPPWYSASTNEYDFSAYKTETDGITPFGEQRHWLTDDYVKFFRFAENLILKNNEGILAYVSNNGYLDNPTCRGMRGSLLRTFDKIYIVNLHGSTNDLETAPDGSVDENIFDIKLGVSLFIGIKTSTNTDWAKVYYTDLWGKKNEKLRRLDEGELQFSELTVDRRMAYFIPFGNSDKDSYEKGISIASLFPQKVTGIISGKDPVAIAFTRTELVERVNFVRNSTNKEIDELWGKYNRGQNADRIREDVLDDGKISKIDVCPFDSRWTYYSGKSCKWLLWPREKETMGNMISDVDCPIGSNIGLVYCKTSRSFFKPFISTNLITHRLFSARCEITYFSPLYIENNTRDENGWVANIDSNLYNRLTENISYSPSVIDIFDYVYGILHDPVYCDRYEEYLVRDFPRVPIVNNLEDKNNEASFFVSEEDFKKYVSAGKRLRKLHLFKEIASCTLTLEPNSFEDLLITQVKYQDGMIQINKNKKIRGINSNVWDYTIGGYKPIYEWLMSRKGKSISRDMFAHLEKMAGSISETLSIEQELKNMHSS